MIRWRCTATNALPVTMSPLFGPRTKAAIVRSISETSRTLTGLTSTPSDGAMDWMAANWAGPEASAGSRSTPARVTVGAISLSSSSHFALSPYSNEVNPVALPPGRAKLSTKPAPTGSGTITNTIVHAARDLQHRRRPRIAGDEDDIRRERDQFRRISAKTIGLAASPAGLDVHIAPDRPTRLLQALQKCPMARLSERIVGSRVSEHTDAPHPLLLRARRQRPRGRGAAEQRDEIATFHSSNPSARASTVSGTVRPSVLAVFRLTTSSNLVGCCTGKSDGFSPRKIRSM